MRPGPQRAMRAMAQGLILPTMLELKHINPTITCYLSLAYIIQVMGQLQLIVNYYLP